MTAAKTICDPILRSAAGEPPLGRGGEFFLPEQGEIFEHENMRYRSPATRICVLALDGGTWLASPPSFHVTRPQFASRGAALRAAIAAMIRRARKYMRNSEGQGTHWTEGFGGRVIDWALSLKPMDSRLKPGQDAAEEKPDCWMFTGDDAEQLTRDPVVRHLAEAHAKRRQFPAKHIFSMTTAIDDGRIVSIGTCGCSHVIKFGSNDFVRMNAAIEAHWRRHGDGPMVDGRGVPIKPGDGARISAAKQKVSGAPIVAGVENGKIELSAEDGATNSAAKPGRRRKADAHPKAADIPESAKAALTEPDLLVCHAGEFGSTGIQSSGGGVDRKHENTLSTDRAPAGVAPGPSEAIAAACQPSVAEQIDWDGLWSVAWQLPLDDIVAHDLVARGLIFAIDPKDRSRGFNPTQLGSERVEALKPLFDLQETRQRLGLVKNSDGPCPVPSASAATQTACDEGGSAGAGLASDGPARRMSDDDGSLAPGRISQCEDDASPGPSDADAAAQIPVSAKPAQICASEDGCEGDDYLAGIMARADAEDVDDLAIDWPSYDRFLEDKIVVAPLRGIEVPREALHPYLKPHCKDLTVWALRLGCAAIFASFGLHKTAMQLEWCRQLARHTGQPTLSVVPLGVRHGFIKEALNLGMDVRFIRTTAELDDLYCDGVRHFLTNYESIREGKLDPNAFGAVSLDEASVLRSYGSKTFQEFLPLFAKVPFKLVATATPSPNRYKELIHYAGFLGVMDTGLALTRFFQRNSEKAGDLTLYPHKEDEFWMWVHSWAAFLQKPSELGHSDEGYELPPLDLRWHEVPADHSRAEPERDGQGVMFRDVAVSLQGAAKARRDSLPARIAKMMEIIDSDPDAHFLLWHDLEAEREAIEQALPEVVTITGSGMGIDEREVLLADFEEGRTKYFGTKPTLSGSGSNFQYHCHRMIFVALPGFGYKFNDFIQALHRLLRFGQTRQVIVDIIYAEDERAGRAALEAKWALDAEMRARMSEIIRAHGLNTLPLRDALLRAIGVQRVEIEGKGWLAINNDAVAECQAWPEASVDLIVTSIPFSNHYEYSPSYRDFGHTDDNGHFWSQMDFLTCELARMLKPGRLACIHVKDRVLFGAVTGEGVPTISPFHAEAIMHYRAHGLQFMGMITVVTDVVRENNQTYRLGWTECAKDGTKMGVGCPEYVLLFRRRQSDRSRGYADVPVTKDKESYTRARWQLDAHAFWRSSGNRLLSTAEFAHLEAADHARLFAKISADRVYDYEAHVRIGEALERQGTLPATFMAIAPGSHHDAVWHDVNRMRTLNMLQQRKGAEMHLCPLQFDIVDRLIERFSNEGELVFDPFGGLMTVPYRALLKKRRGTATELSASYFMDGVHYLRLAEEQMATPDLFDLMAFDKANTSAGDDMMEGAA
ncbi:DNA methyltransferase [Bradyrhizobium oligotrophicum]|uniref:DNA methyltransferase n=1 Tax=Bradyrhizobium TaxID=374 RepID=UPI003EBA9C04